MRENTLRTRRPVMPGIPSPERKKKVTDRNLKNKEEEAESKRAGTSR